MLDIIVKTHKKMLNECNKIFWKSMQGSDEVINSNEEFITEAGDIESWVGKGKQALLQNRDETIKYLQSLKK
jgi:hypothetical protein